MGSHKLHKLTSLFVKKTIAPGKYGDGHGLYLIVDASGAKRWEQRLVIQGRRRDIGLGSVALVSLEEARKQALKNKRLARSGGDPIAEKCISIGAYRIGIEPRPWAPLLPSFKVQDTDF